MLRKQCRQNVAQPVKAVGLEDPSLQQDSIKPEGTK